MITGNILRSAVISGANNIYNNRQKVDELNVFPVPDGDTGTNMTLTMTNAAKELAVKKDMSVGDTAKVVSSALLRGARGNSGVILSLIFRGFSKGLKGLEEAGAQDVVNALKSGVDAAYKAVMKPTEGTILTVSKEAANSAATAVENGETDPVKVFEIAVEGAKVALAQTPEILPVLKKAGVVDAGGQGLVVIFEGMLRVFKGEGEIASEDAESSTQKQVVSVVAQNDEEITFTYCTEFIVNRDRSIDRDPIRLRSYLETIGDCVVVVDDDAIIKVHVHTDNPGKALQEGLKFGALTNMKIENMREQHENIKRNDDIKNTVKSDKKGEYTPAVPENDYGFVAVAAGEGIQALFTELGADAIVSGGQTMNPSTDDILRAVELTPAKNVFVLPNNKNIIMASEQAARLATRNVIVLQTKSIPMGINAMIAFDPDADAETNAQNMQTHADKVSTGQITFAARNSDYDGFKIKEGEILALKNGKLKFVEKDVDKATVRMIKELAKKDSQYATLIYGEDISDESAEAVKNAIEAKMPNLEVTLIPGKQPVYYYIMSVE
ncbi:MAG: DAK2 domain-containing protein [Acutalibacteraceae bacterium]|nr:DAK2 domain-containing protein [Acutalibacteraceae bacterium]